MTRVKGGFTRRRKHKKVLRLAKGYRMTKSKLYKVAHEAVLHAGEYAFMGRKLRKRNFRRLWISRINIALKPMDLKYSRFISNLKKNNVEIDRKILAYFALEKPRIFEKIVKKVSN